MPFLSRHPEARSMPAHSRFALVLACAGLALLSGCVTAPPSAPRHPAPRMPPAFAAPAAQGPAKVEQDAAWWKAWGDPALDSLVSRALAANADIRVASAHVRAARAMAAVAESALYPTVAAGGAVWASDGSGAIEGPLGTLLSASPGSTTGTRGGGHVLALGAAWEPDVFGAHHADLATARALEAAVAEEESGARLIVAGDVVENWQQAAGLTRRIALADRSIALAEQLLAYARGRMAAGQADAADVAKAEAALASITANRAPLVELRTIRLRRLAVLAGDLPEQPVTLPQTPVPVLPEAPGGTVPSDMLDRRPDLRAAGAMVDAAAARLKRARADLLPRFTLAFVGENGRLALSGLPPFGGSNLGGGVGVSVPVFTAGRLQARVRAEDAGLEAALARHDGAVLTALEDVEAAYGLRHALDLRWTEQARGLAASSARAQADEALFRAGRITLGTMLEAELAALADADALEQTRLAQGSATVQLIRALGGGWAGHDAPPRP